MGVMAERAKERISEKSEEEGGRDGRGRSSLEDHGKDSAARGTFCFEQRLVSWFGS